MLNFTGERIVPQANNCEPNFASRMMHEHLVRYLFAGQLVAGQTVLDVGCGVGYGAQKLGQLGAASVTAFDISPEAVAHAARYYSHPAVRFELGNAENFTLGVKFDIVTCFEMIEHVEHPDRVLKCIKQHLKPDGILIASTPRFLGEKRTHFHVREFDLEDYAALVERFFPNTQMYVENNHFSSLILTEPASRIERVEYLKDQFSLNQADVFISVSCAAKAQLPVMQPSVVFDDDGYVQMLERDVAILHKAEDDVRASLDAERANAREVIEFKDAEIARLVDEYNALFERAKAESDSFAKSRTELEKAHHDRLKQLEGDVAVLRKAEQDLLSSLEAERAKAKAESTFKDSEISRLIGEYNALFQRAEADSKNFAKARLDLEKAHRGAVEQLEGSVADLRKRESELAAALVSEKEQTKTECARRDSKIDRLTQAGEALRAEIAEKVDQLKDAEMKFADLKLQQDELQKTLGSLLVRVNDADARRLEAYEFARVTSNEALALRRELDILKRDLVEALDHPEVASTSPAADQRHRDIVESMERLFIGTEATHAGVRNPLVIRVASLAAENRALAEEVERLGAEASEQRGRAERAEAFGEDWHEQILKLRKSMSWRATKPFRAVGRLFR